MKARIHTKLGYFLFFLLSVLFSLLIGQGAVYIRNQGAFVSWKPLAVPIKFDRIVQATSAKVWGQASDNSIYEGDIYCQEENNCQAWQVIEQVPVDLPTPEYPIERASGCEFHEFLFGKHAPIETIECVRANFGFADSSTVVYYALLNDGSIALWKLNRSKIEDFVIAFCSAILASLTIWLFGFIAWKRKTSERTKAG